LIEVDGMNDKNIAGYMNVDIFRAKMFSVGEISFYIQMDLTGENSGWILV
jgi:hypothetical protein